MNLVRLTNPTKELARRIFGRHSSQHTQAFANLPRCVSALTQGGEHREVMVG
jgi:hypothetical protein